MMRFNILADGSKAEFENVKEIIIFGSGKEIARLEASRFGIGRMKEREGKEPVFYENEYDAKITEINLLNGFKLARKENLSRNDNYYMSVKPEYSRQGKQVALYIHERECKVENLGNILANEMKDEKCFQQGYKLLFLNGGIIRHGHVERIECSSDWKITDGGRWGNGYGTEKSPCYDTFDSTGNPLAIMRGTAGKGVIKKWVTFDEVTEITGIFVTGCYSKIEYSENRKKAMNLAKQIKENCGLQNFNFYDAEKLMKYFNITPKEA